MLLHTKYIIIIPSIGIVWNDITLDVILSAQNTRILSAEWIGLSDSHTL